MPFAPAPDPTCTSLAASIPLPDLQMTYSGAWLVVPAKAGTPFSFCLGKLDPRVRGEDDFCWVLRPGEGFCNSLNRWFPAFAGTTSSPGPSDRAPCPRG